MGALTKRDPAVLLHTLNPRSEHEMATLTPFDQSNLLVGVADPRVRDGICVALCDYWLALMKANTHSVRLGNG